MINKSRSPSFRGWSSYQLLTCLLAWDIPHYIRYLWGKVLLRLCHHCWSGMGLWMLETQVGESKAIIKSLLGCGKNIGRSLGRSLIAPSSFWTGPMLGVGHKIEPGCQSLHHLSFGAFFSLPVVRYGGACVLRNSSAHPLLLCTAVPLALPAYGVDTGQGSGSVLHEAGLLEGLLVHPADPE